MIIKEKILHSIVFIGIFATNITLADMTISQVEYGPGDRKAGYDSVDYTTNSLSLEARIGKPADLLALMKNPPLGLPAIKQPANNHATEQKLHLGKQLFFDRRLSFNGTISCATCHIPEQGFTNNEIKTAVGFQGRSVKRNSPTMFNVAYLTRLFHDGREFTLEQLAWSPLLAHNEMANPSMGYVIHKIRNTDNYAELFDQAFDGQGVTIDTVGKALAVYQRTLVSADSRFDRWYFGGDSSQLTDQEKQGFEIFTGKGNCSACHTINNDYALFTDNKLHNTGMGYQESMGVSEPTQRIQLAPGVYAEVEREVVESFRQKPKQSDLGLYELTQDPDDRWKYRTPTLRNVALTAPYMHNGKFLMLREVIEFYNKGGIENELLSPLLRPLNLSEEEVDSMVAFLKTLTGGNVDTLVADAFSVPVKDIKDGQDHRKTLGSY
tara:strand:- start:18065 stop:19375 length:1311 start_codon:yes stop_codon:yes gene_type:complete